jgi:hypothetical protein
MEISERLPGGGAVGSCAEPSDGLESYKARSAISPVRRYSTAAFSETSPELTTIMIPRFDQCTGSAESMNGHDRNRTARNLPDGDDVAVGEVRSSRAVQFV